MDDIDRFIILTGGPGSGKSTLIAELAKSGYAHASEAGRAIIQAQAAIGGKALPWTDPTAFAELMLSWDMRSYEQARELKGPVFFDRGIPDVLGYLTLSNVPTPTHVQTAAQLFRYGRVFIAPPWREIFEQDNERKQNFDEAQRTYDAMTDTYQRLGYVLVELPKASVADRCAFVLETAGLKANNSQPT
ncbi:conserved protein of unknown function [Candidatus Filomicrobium marinum]|uniref:NadR/Ttd14 AAA domain-containing protein n=1 Tax=Candidatus Filomicrobium marinum TaxID=1608628 RepID=A0A0D6JJQ5_9HYPH|nr:AAA family ATPase [Candidatus Filomicrobium marinum]CFX33587.1 conserved protein of unknown function [Candidatus Filomicrobium marinum]CPR21907.1 conserved protein of unknown function [Candidatus Filomicrobium marinum]